MAILLSFLTQTMFDSQQSTPMTSKCVSSVHDAVVGVTLQPVPPFVQKCPLCYCTSQKRMGNM